MSDQVDDLGLPPRFWTKVNKNGPEARPGLGPCWLWTATKTAGYGNFRVGSKRDGTRRKELSHRLVLAAKLNRDIAPDMDVCHECDVHACVNPSHLWEGSAADNMADCVSKGRQSRGTAKSVIMKATASRGETHVHAKLTDSQVEAIRLDERRQHLIAADYGITQAHVSALKSGRRRQRRNGSCDI